MLFLFCFNFSYLYPIPIHSNVFANFLFSNANLIIYYKNSKNCNNCLGNIVLGIGNQYVLVVGNQLNNGESVGSSTHTYYFCSRLLFSFKLHPLCKFLKHCIRSYTVKTGAIRGRTTNCCNSDISDYVREYISIVASPK